MDSPCTYIVRIIAFNANKVISDSCEYIREPRMDVPCACAAILRKLVFYHNRIDNVNEQWSHLTDTQNRIDRTYNPIQTFSTFCSDKRASGNGFRHIDAALVKNLFNNGIHSLPFVAVELFSDFARCQLHDRVVKLRQF